MYNVCTIEHLNIEDPTCTPNMTYFLCLLEKIKASIFIHIHVLHYNLSVQYMYKLISAYMYMHIYCPNSCIVKTACVHVALCACSIVYIYMNIVHVHLHMYSTLNIALFCSCNRCGG